MKIHLICPVRGVTEEQQKEIDDYAAQLMVAGYEVHNPKYAVDQEDETGFNICLGHLDSMKKADRVDVFWDLNSKGSHFDLGMAFALNKSIKLVKTYQPDNEGKSYVKVMQKVEELVKYYESLPGEIKKIQELKVNLVKEHKFDEACICREREKELTKQWEESKK